MGLFESIFRRPASERAVRQYFKTFSAYEPKFTTYGGSLYEMAITRAAIHVFATHVSKLKPEVPGADNQAFERMLQYRPNPFMDTTKFLYRLATIFAVTNTAFIVPLYAKDLTTIVGYYPILPHAAEIMEFRGEPWLRYKFNNGQTAAIELRKAGILTQHQYKSDFFGETNRALHPTMALIDTQNQGIINGVKQGAGIRFMARLGNTLKDKTVQEERARFVADNLSPDNNSGVMMFDAKYSEVKQIDSRPWIVDAEQMKVINENVYNYFGVNKSILQNDFTSASWNAFYEGKIEPFAIQLSLVMTNMTFSEREVAYGNHIMFTANRLQYATPQEKLDIATQLFDRGMLTQNEGREIFNMTRLENGDKFYIRKEYEEQTEQKEE